MVVRRTKAPYRQSQFTPGPASIIYSSTLVPLALRHTNKRTVNTENLNTVDYITAYQGKNDKDIVIMDRQEEKDSHHLPQATQ